VIKGMIDPLIPAADGKYTVQLYNYSQRQVVPVVVDDQIPQNSQGGPAFTNLSESAELWPCIVEKAIAKLAGGYDQIQCGHSLFIMGMLAGCDDLLAIQQDPPGSEQWVLIKPEYRVSNPHSSQNTLSYGTWLDGSRGAKAKTSSDVMGFLAHFAKQKYFMVCGCTSEDADQGNDSLEHGYTFTILSVAVNIAGAGLTLLLVHDPWGVSEWTGDWSDGSPLWQSRPDIRAALDYEPSYDGSFWIDAHNFSKKYTFVNVCCRDVGKSRTIIGHEKKSSVLRVLAQQGLRTLCSLPKKQRKKTLKVQTVAASALLARINSFTDRFDAPAVAKKFSTTMQHMAPMVGNGSSPMTAMSKVARDIQEVAQDSPEQMRFFSVWSETVLDPASSSAQLGGRLLLVSTDMSVLEVNVTGEAPFMMRLAREFIEACAVPNMKMLETLERAQVELQVPEVTLWCRLKCMGGPAPGVDAGCIFNRELEWQVADVLMPCIDAQDALREHAVEEEYKPCRYGSSVLPTEPERSLGFEMVGEAPKRRLLSGLLFFKALGFERPKDEVVRVLSLCQPLRCGVSAALGPRGLTRVSLRMHKPASPVAEELSSCLGFAYASGELRRVAASLGLEANVVEYAIEARGYTVTVGFSA